MIYYPISKKEWDLHQCKMTSDYGPRKDPITGKPAFHYGIDYAPRLDKTNVELIASCDGLLFTGVETIVRNGKTYKALYTRITRSDGHKIYTYHDDRFLVIGGQVKAGQPIAIMGATGYVTGIHVDFRVKNPSGDYVDPKSMGLVYFLNKNEMAKVQSQKMVIMKPEGLEVKAQPNTKSKTVRICQYSSYFETYMCVEGENVEGFNGWWEVADGYINSRWCLAVIGSVDCSVQDAKILEQQAQISSLTVQNEALKVEVASYIPQTVYTKK